MQAEEYWPMAQKYGIWNAAIASLQFWADDLEPVTLGEASECVYYYFFWIPISHTLCQLPEETLFGCFVLTLNAAFMQELSLQDKGYNSGSNEDVPTPLSTSSAMFKINVSSQVEKHMTYFLQRAISFWYSSATIQNNISLGQYIPNIIEYQIIMQSPRDIHLKSVNLSINLAKHEKQYSPSQTTMISVTSKLQCHQILL